MTQTADKRMVTETKLTQELNSAQGSFPAHKFGAVGDGVTDDRLALQNAIDAAAAKGGTVELQAGKTYGWSGNLIVKSGVYLAGTATRQNLAIGASPIMAGLVALSSNSQLNIGQRSGGDTPGGVSNLYVDGNFVGGDTASVSKPGLARIAGVNVMVFNLFVVRSAGDGIVYDATQNSTIVGGDSTEHKGCALVLDNGPGALAFQGGYYGNSKGGAIKCRDTTGETNGYAFGPTQITFSGTIAEAYPGLSAPLAEPNAHHVHLSGTQIVCVGTNFTGGAENDVDAVVLIDSTCTSFIPPTVTFVSALFWVHQAHDVIRVVGPGVLSFVGNQSVSDNGTNHGVSFIAIDGGTPHISMQGEVILNGDVNGANIYRTLNSGSTNGCFTWREGGQQFRLRTGQVVSGRREGDTGHRWYIDRDGTIGWFDGTPGSSKAYVKLNGTGLDFYTAGGDYNFLGGAPARFAGDVYANGVLLTGSGGGGSSVSPNETMQLTRVERQSRQKVDTCNRRVIARTADASVITELWQDLSQWTGTVTPSIGSGKMYGATSGVNRDISALAGVGKRLMVRAVLTVPVGSIKYGYLGFSNEAPGVAPVSGGANAFMIGVNFLQWGLLKGANVTGSASNTPSGSSGNGDFIFTGIIDETGISLSVAPKTNPGQVIASSSILRSQMPGGPAINNIILSDSDTTPGLQWGPLQIISDIAPPAKSQQTPGGVALWGAENPIHVNRRDPVTGIRHLLQIPGDYDPRVPMPIVEFLHWSLAATGATPYTDSRMDNVLSALLAAGYMVLSSDNGPATTVGGTQDKFGNQAGIDDYAAAIEWTRQHFNTGAVCLLGTSQGGMFAQNILASRLVNAIGGIAAAASISGATDTNLVAANSTFTSLIEAAFGVSTLPALAAALISTDLNPIAQTKGDLRGVPQRFYIALDDTLTPKASHVDPMVTTLGDSVPEASVVTVATGGHLAAALFQGSDLVTFYDKYAK